MIRLCGHCGNNTTYEKHGEYLIKDERYDAENKTWVEDQIQWVVDECMTCHKPTFSEYHLDAIAFEVRSKILYPSIQTNLTNLPADIDGAYTAAIKVKNIEPNACAVLVGRTLEAACNHEQAQGRTLAQKLNYLAQNGRIPNTLAEMARQLKELRNLGAHDAEDEVTEQDVPIILDFLEAILEYLYVAPAKIEAVRTRLIRLPTPESTGEET